MKIQIIGYAGSGKSTLAKKLGLFYNIPYLHLDNVQFYGNWQERSKAEQNKIVDEFLNNNDEWVIDGNYSIVSSKRFEISDITIFLSYNRFYCYRMCKRRYKMYKHTRQTHIGHRIHRIIYVCQHLFMQRALTLKRPNVNRLSPS